MCSADQVNVVCSIEFFDDITTKQVSSTTRTCCPTFDVYGKRNKKNIIKFLAWILDGFVVLLPSGSLHIISHMAPSCGTSCFLSIAMIYKKKQSKELQQNSSWNSYLYLIKGINLRWEPSVDTEEFLFDDRRKWEIIEDLSAISPDI